MYHQLTEPERYTLSVLRREGRTFRAIAQALGRSPSTISREVRRNATLNAAKGRSFYVPSKAQEHANGRRSRSRRVKHHGPEVYAHIEARLSEVQWSPEQIAKQLPQGLGVTLSHMTIYRHVRRDQRAGGNLFKQLRQGGKRRRKRTYGVEKRGKLSGKAMIDSRPGVIELRQEIGHWEGDTVMGSSGSGSGSATFSSAAYCVLDKVGSVQTDAAVLTIQQACHSKFPPSQTEVQAAVAERAARVQAQREAEASANAAAAAAASAADSKSP